ncbi:MAG: hypothetical protein KatS3mg102_1018 [Planctomycetota bacterium]|nr:MAG: hypothetical protein KatS3mg102_1018 [Planctomycetota bacterium]
MDRSCPARLLRTALVLALAGAGGAAPLAASEPAGPARAAAPRQLRAAAPPAQGEQGADGAGGPSGTRAPDPARSSPPAGTRHEGGAPGAPDGGPGPEQAPAAAAPPDGGWCSRLAAGFAAAADWFLARGEGEEQHARTWGFVPLVVADSTQGFGGGVQFVETDLLGLGIRVAPEVLASHREFFQAGIELRGPPLLLRPAPALYWSVQARYRSRPRLLFYGIGNGTERGDRASLWLEDTLAELQLGHRFFAEHVALSAIARLRNVNARDGTHPRIPKVSEAFAVDSIAGFTEDGFTHALGASLLLDHRDNDFDPKRGFRLEVGALYHGPEIGDSPFRFGLYFADLAWYQPLVGTNLVAAVRGRIELVDASLRRVPFYALPSLGGRDTLRGFLEGRFRDRHAVLLQGEVRFPIWRVLAGAVFADAGRVFHDVTDPPFFKDFHVDAGLGLRLVIHPDILSRLDVAFSDEEVTFGLSFGQTF